MISEERLEELIKQGATVYEYTNNYIWELELKTDWYVMNNCLREVKLSKHAHRLWSISDLFETKEEAEFYVEFSCIERTERLELPTWEDFNRVEFYTTTGRVIFEKIIESYPTSINSDKFKDYEFIGIAKIMFDDGSCYYYHEPATKENYIKACREVKKLFLGGE